MKLFLPIFAFSFFLTSSYGDVFDYEKDPYRSVIHFASYQYNVPPSLIRALIKVESDFNRKARSPAGALGLMQLMPETAKRLGVLDVFDARQNILGGTCYFRELLNKFSGNLELALAAYNAGEDAVQRFNSIPPFAETQKFVKLVLKYYEYFNQKP